LDIYVVNFTVLVLPMISDSNKVFSAMFVTILSELTAIHTVGTSVMIYIDFEQ